MIIMFSLSERFYFTMESLNYSEAYEFLSENEKDVIDEAVKMLESHLKDECFILSDDEIELLSEALLLAEY